MGDRGVVDACRQRRKLENCAPARGHLGYSRKIPRPVGATQVRGYPSLLLQVASSRDNWRRDPGEDLQTRSTILAGRRTSGEGNLPVQVRNECEICLARKRVDFQGRKGKRARFDAWLRRQGIEPDEERFTDLWTRPSHARAFRGFDASENTGV